jgi:hypothetical protein
MEIIVPLKVHWTIIILGIIVLKMVKGIL